LIIFGPNNINQNDNQVHHKSIIQNGIQTLHETHELTSESYIAARGPIAFATSFDQ
jgi:cold shock CspA family protein